jgi:signal transduction histidine kinase
VAAPLKTPQDRPAVLLVDDQPARLLASEAILEALPIELVKARSGTEALARLMEREFAAILLDVNMPGMDGFETATLIHRHPRFEKTPIIFVTAVHVTDLDRLKGYELGAVDYVYVPVVPEILRSKVQVLVELYAQRKALERLNAELERTNSTMQAERARELDELNRTLERANAELESANAGLVREIGERKRAETALKEADERKNTFLATLSHELRNPMAAIANAVRLLQVTPPGDPRAAASRDILGRQVVHLVRLIDDLLDVSRITTGKITLRKERVEIGTALASAVETVRPMLLERRQKLDLQAPREPLYVHADPVRLAQIVSNLLANATKFTGDEGLIELSLERGEDTDATAAGHAVLVVRDNGVGLEPAAVPTIFELFSQGAHEDQRAGDGLGVGLALVRELVALHDGSVEAASAGRDRGAAFTVRLPLVDAPAADAPPGNGRSARAQGRGGADSHRILVVDDNRDAAESLAALLALLGHEVAQAYDGPAALELARTQDPDLILLDIGMPGMSGHEVARQLRLAPEARGVTLIALTGYGSADDRRASQEAGFDGHLVKPIDFEALERTLLKLPPARRPSPQQPEAA